MSDALDALAKAHGIEPAFTDYFGREHLVSDDTKRALLAAMGADETAQASALAPVAVMRSGEPADGLFSGAQRWEVELESGERFSGDTRGLPLGYHRVHAVVHGRAASSALIVVPPACFVPEDAGERFWALSTQLYALRSARNWGIGDFTDLAVLAELAAAAGARAIALNPLHELNPSNPYGSSPYSPSSRLFLNGMYVDVTAVPELDDSGEARALVADPSLRARLDEYRSSNLIDYGGVAHAKRRVLEALFESFRQRRLQRPGDARAGRFRAFVREGGEALERLARYEALTEHFRAGNEDVFGWLQFPPEYRSPDGVAVEAFAREHADRVDYYRYVQFLADEQLAAAAKFAGARGAGLYRDLAVGTDLNSSDAWSDQHTIVGGASLGAPPDHLNAHGQNWGLPPHSPAALRARAYAPFVALLRANMRYARVLRIDHVMALRRGFWIPRGKTPLEGAYVDAPFEDLLGIVALESVRHRCVVVGEDLGTVPEGFRERLARNRMLSSRLIYFERGFLDGKFAPPASYPKLAAASIGTHDLPPLLGWWIGDDITLRERIGLYPSPEAVGEAVQERRHARFMAVDALESAACIDGDGAARLRADAEAGGSTAVGGLLSESVHRFLAATPSLLHVVAIEDVLGEIDAVNVPGTTDQHPNWQRKRSLPIEALAADGRLFRIGAILRETARSGVKEATL